MPVATPARVINYELPAFSPDHLTEIRELRRGIEDEIRILVNRDLDTKAFSVKNPRIAAAAWANRS